MSSSSNQMKKPMQSEEKLKRFLYISSQHNFVTGDPEVHRHYDKQEVAFIGSLIESNIDTVLRIVQIANSENAVPKRDTLFLTLGIAAASEIKDDAKRKEIYTTVLNISKNDDDFFMFIKYATLSNKKCSSGINKIIRKYYSTKESMQLLKDVCLRKGYHGWTHKDLIKLSHMKTDNQLLEVITTYILKNVEAAEAKANNNSECMSLIQYMKKMSEFKSTMDENVGVKYIKEYKFSWDQVPPQLMKSQKVWEALLDHIDTKTLIYLLPRMYKIGLLKTENVCLTKVQKILTDVSKTSESDIHPIEVFIGLRNFENGGKPKDPKLIKYLEDAENSEAKALEDPKYKKPDFKTVEPVKCPTIISALNKTLMHSYENVKPTMKRFLITVAVTESMNKPCITTKNVSCMEAAAITLLSFLKSEKQCTVAVFNGETITPVSLDKGGSVSQTIKKLQEVEHEGELHGAPMKWAETKKKSIDVFININSEVSLSFKEKLNHPINNLLSYKNAMKMWTTKFIVMNFGRCMMMAYDENSILDVRGFDKNVPKVMDAFIKNLF